MKKFIQLVMVIFLALSAGSCTRNDGNIGIWFGSWSQTSMTVDGQAYPSFSPNTTIWEFQNNIVEISLMGDHHSKQAISYGTWVERDGKLLLDFTHSENGVQGGTGMYQAPAWLLIEPDTTVELKIVSRQSGKVRFQYVNDAGQTIEYTIKKTW